MKKYFILVFVLVILGFTAGVVWAQNSCGNEVSIDITEIVSGENMGVVCRENGGFCKNECNLAEEYIDSRGDCPREVNCCIPVNESSKLDCMEQCMFEGETEENCDKFFCNEDRDVNIVPDDAPEYFEEYDECLWYCRMYVLYQERDYCEKLFCKLRTQDPDLVLATPTPTPEPKSYCEGKTLVKGDGSRQNCSNDCEEVDDNNDGIIDRARCTGFGNCGDCNTCLSNDTSLCRTVYQEGTCQKYGFSAPCCLEDNKNCGPDAQPFQCGYGDDKPDSYCDKCQYWDRQASLCLPEWVLSCGNGGPAKVRAKTPIPNSIIDPSMPMKLSWFAYNEGFARGCGEKLPGTWPKWENCNGTTAYGSHAECITTIAGGGGGMNAGDRNCWGYTCAKGSWGIPSQWRFYEIYLKAPGETEFSKIKTINDIPDPSYHGGSIAEEKSSVEFNPRENGVYQWYVVAGANIGDTGHTTKTQSDIFEFEVRPINISYQCYWDGSILKARIFWEDVVEKDGAAIRVDNLKDKWNFSDPNECRINGKGNGKNDGDYCIDDIDNNELRLQVDKNQEYHFWVHFKYPYARYGNPSSHLHNQGEYWSQSVDGYFSCSGETEEISLTPQDEKIKIPAVTAINEPWDTEEKEAPDYMCSQIESSSSIVEQGEEITFTCQGYGNKIKYADFVIVEVDNIEKSISGSQGFGKILHKADNDSKKAEFNFATENVKIGKYKALCRVCQDDKKCSSWGKAIKLD